MMMRRMELDDVDAQLASPPLSFPSARIGFLPDSRESERASKHARTACINRSCLPASTTTSVVHLGLAFPSQNRLLGHCADGADPSRWASQELASQSYVILATSASCPPGQTTALRTPTTSPCQSPSSPAFLHLLPFATRPRHNHSKGPAIEQTPQPCRPKNPSRSSARWPL